MLPLVAMGGLPVSILPNRNSPRRCPRAAASPRVRQITDHAVHAHEAVADNLDVLGRMSRSDLGVHGEDSRVDAEVAFLLQVVQLVDASFRAAPRGQISLRAYRNENPE